MGARNATEGIPYGWLTSQDRARSFRLNQYRRLATLAAGGWPPACPVVKFSGLVQMVSMRILPCSLTTMAWLILVAISAVAGGRRRILLD